MSGIFFLLSLIAVGFVIHWFMKTSASKSGDPLREGLFAIKPDPSPKSPKKKFSPWNDESGA